VSAHKKWFIWSSVALIAFIGIWWLVFGYWLDETARQRQWFFHAFLERGFFPGGPNPVHFTWWTWFFVATALLIVAGYKIYDVRSNRFVDAKTFKEQPYWQLIVRSPFALIGLVVFALGVVVFCFHINDHSAAYAGSTTFIVEDTDNLPGSLKRLGDDTDPNQNGCALYAYDDMRGCIQEGTFDFEWDNRGSSATGALTVIKRSGSGNSKTQLLEDTLTYVYGMGDNGVWTAIRDGKSKQPIYGVLSYAGEGNVQTCRFTGQYALNMAFGGHWNRSLADDIAAKYPNLFYQGSDRYGYCDGDQPVIVIPMREQETFRTRMAYRSAGVLVIKGSASGAPVYERIKNVKAGELPGPAYPASLASEQRESMGMIAGIGDSVFGSFGYKPTDVETQSGNASEYQLRDKSTGRVYWVTPMIPRGGDSQSLAAYTVISADEATEGSLNEQRIYVLPDDDPRAVNLEDLEARTRDALNREDPGFYAAKGKLVEFLPLSSDSWQVYAELSGRVVYRIEVPTDARIEPKVFSLTSSSSEDDPDGTQDQASACVEDLSALDDKDLAQCLSDIADELNSRQN